jgi:hypothetical protein
VAVSLSTVAFPAYEIVAAMGLLTFSINVTLDGCVDHREGIADDETHAACLRTSRCLGTT